VDLYLSFSKNKKYIIFNEEGKQSILVIWDFPIIRNTKTNKDEKILETETEDGKKQICIVQHIYRIICYGS
jgi:hypothetical protein